jgi:hypothetical protein
MVLVRTIPRLGALPELFGFYCARCRRAETIEHSVGLTTPMMLSDEEPFAQKPPARKRLAVGVS